MSPVITTPRLILRQWRDDDSNDFAAINANAEVMRYFPKPLKHTQSDALLEILQSDIDRDGFGYWCAQLKSSGRCIGFVGFRRLYDEVPFAPCLDLGWRLCESVWKQGLAFEGAAACLRYAFQDCDFPVLHAQTAAHNMPFIGLKRKLGMKNCELNFMHTRMPQGHKLSEHVVYSIDRDQWQRSQTSNK